MTDSKYVLTSFTDLYNEIKIPLNQTQRVKVFRYFIIHFGLCYCFIS